MRTPRMMITLAAGIAFLVAVLFGALPARAVLFLSPTTAPNAPYQSFANSPFAVGTPTTFYLETFEDGALNTPGASVSAVGAVTNVGHNPSFVDSVDGDDGSIDGDGSDGWSLGVGGSGAPANSTITFTFNAGALGQYPTHAGIVFTDMGRSLTSPPNLDGSHNGFGILSFEAFDALGVSLGSIGPFNVGDGVKNGTVSEDRFFGVIDFGGISKIAIKINSHDAEFDHLQYGFSVAVPESGGIWVCACVGLLGVIARSSVRWASR